MLYYGCDYYPEHWPESRWMEDARLMHEAGFNVVRIGEFAWAKMEPAEGHYDWHWLDRAIGQVPGPPPGHLADVMGVTAEEFNSLPPEQTNQVQFVEGLSGTVPVALWFEVLLPTTARPLAVYQGDCYAGRPAATLRQVDQGRAIYVGGWLGPREVKVLKRPARPG